MTTASTDDLDTIDWHRTAPGERLGNAPHQGPNHHATWKESDMAAASRVTGTTLQESIDPDLIPPDRCPKCGAVIVSTVTRTARGIVFSDRLCANGDPSYLKWVA